MRSCFIRSGYLGFRFLRYRFSPCIVLAIALLNLPFSSGSNRIIARIRYMRAMSKIDFAWVYELINDLLW